MGYKVQLVASPAPSEKCDLMDPELLLIKVGTHLY